MRILRMPAIAFALGTVLAISIGLLVSPAWGVAIATPGSAALADLINTPNKIYRYDPAEDIFGTPVIRWKMTQQFKDKFPLPKQREQVRLAIAEWEEGMFSGIRRAAPTYEWTRWSGVSDFLDLRSILTHEIGHALGSQHPDAAWFNDSGNGTPYNQNYIRVGNAWQAAAPIGGEIMNEGNDATSLPGMKPPRGLPAGAYWRTLSQDELDFLDHAYPTAMDFVEVGTNDDAELIIDLFAVGQGPGSAIGHGGIDTSEPFDPDDADQGRRILTGVAKVREEASQPIGFKALPRNWEITNNTGEPINSVIITARGTNNPVPTTWSSSGAKKFTFQGALVPQLPNPQVFDIEDVSHLFTQAQNGPINNGQSVDVGMRKDVWDWTVVNSQAIQADGDFVNIGLVSIQGFNFMSPVVPNDDGTPDDILLPNDDLLSLQGTFDILVKGIKLVNQEDSDVMISEIAYGPAPDLNPNRTDLLNSDALGRLQASGEVQFISLSTPLTLAPGECFYLLLAGSPSGLPDDVLQSGKWMIGSPPRGPMDEQLFVYTASQGGGFDVNNFALLNTPVFVPEPTTLALIMLALVFCLCGNRRNSR